MSGPTSRPGWFTWVACPHCRAEHRADWPHPSFPSGGPRHVFLCPVSGRRVVFSAGVWGELDPADPGEDPEVQPFPE
jgi:hypothetical protein